MRPHLATWIREVAADLGLAPVAVARVDAPAPGHDVFAAWLQRGGHAGMAWIEAHAPLRAHPDRLLPGARSVVVVGLPYGSPSLPDPGGPTGRVARYAWGRDYHRVLGRRLQRFVARLREDLPDLGALVSVDTRPVAERTWARAAGLGVQGRNGCLRVPGASSYFFLGCVLVDVDLPPGGPLEDGCASCRRCVEACPTGALAGDGTVDARRCISWLTIEHGGDLPEALRPAMGRWFFGCDACQEACPHNQGPLPPPDPALDPRPERAWVDLATLLQGSDADLERLLSGTALRRAGPERLRRNACVVLGNLGQGREALVRALEHPSPRVRRHAAWGALRCGDGDAVARTFRHEPDPDTRAALAALLDGHSP